MSTQNIELYAQSPGATGGLTYIILDTYPAEPIKISKSVQGLEEPQKTTSSFSKSFRVPHTAKNARFFEAVFNVNAQDFDASKRALAYINVDGAYFMSGLIRLQQIVRNDQTTKIEYELNFYGETSTFGSVVGPKDLSELNLSQYAHSINYQAVTKSWVNGATGLFGGDIVYPLAEYGYTYDANNVPTISTLSVWNGTTSTRGFTNSSYPLDPNQLRPMIRAKAVWDKIFDEAGFTYTSQFLNTAFFKSMYMMSSNTASAVTVASVDADVPVSLSFIFFTAPWQKLLFGQPYVDPANAVNVNNSTYVASYTGSPYTFVLKDLLCDYVLAGGSGPKFFSIRLMRNGVAVSTQSAYVDPGFSANTQYATDDPTGILGLTSFTFSASAVAGDVFHFEIGTSTFKFTYLDIQLGEMNVTGPLVVDPKGLMPFQYKQLDFIKGINERFKLVWEPDPENARNFLIEPWKDWINQGGKRDWTDKLDESKDISLTPLFYTQPRRINYRDSKEGDLYNFLYEQQNKEIFGELKTDSQIEVITGEKTLTNFFAPTPLAPIPGNDSFIIPHFAKDTETQRQPIQIKPRLLFYNGLRSNPTSFTWYLKNGLSSVAQTKYPVASQFDLYPFNQLSFDLNWLNVPQYWDGAITGFYGRTTKTSFTQYWEKWWNFTYDPYSRIMEATFSLNSEDIQTLRFNDIIWVKDAWWMVQEIKDFVLGERQNCRVRLLKLGNNFDYSITSVSDQGPYYPQTLCYSGEDICTACCCENQTLLVYSNLKFMASSYQLFQDSSGSIYAQPGYYSDGTTVWQVGQFGNIITAASCGCSCEPTGYNAFTVCSGPDLCTVCCCGAFGVTVYGDGATLETSTKIYSTVSPPTTVIPNYWYRQSGSSNAVQVGPNGVDIMQVGTCAGCICSELPYVREYGIGPTGSPNDACCPEIGGSITTWSYGQGLTGSTGFYYDPYGQYPVGPSSAFYLSDGDIQRQVINGVPTGPDAVCSVVACPDRTETFNVRLINNTAVNIEMELSPFISFDGVNTFYNQTFLEVGNSFYGIHDAYYTPESYIGFQLTVPPVYGGDITIQIYKGASLVYSDTVLAGTTVGPILGPVGTDLWIANFEWAP